MPIPPDHRSHLEFMRGLDTDAEGRDVLRGLSFEETTEYYAYLSDRLNDRHSKEGRDRFLELHERHERARLDLLMAEHMARSSGPAH